MIWIELLILLSCIVLGARYGGIALGTISGIGLLIFVFVFNLPPGSPPTLVLGMIIAVITALAAMQSAGGLDYLVNVAGKIMRKNPQRITFLAPILTYVLVMASGTQHVIYALLPVISEVSTKAGIRPERPLSISVIAAQHGLISSPISAATVALVGALVGYDVSLIDILLITIPATFLAVLVGILVVFRRGTPLNHDKEYLERIKSGKIQLDNTDSKETSDSKHAKGALAIFLLSISAVVLIGLFPELRPQFSIWDGEDYTSGQLGMGYAIMIIMIAGAGVMMIFFKADPAKAVSGSIMKGGLIAIISILGVSWMGSSFFEGNKLDIVSGISEVIQERPWIFAMGLFVLSMLLFSQAATVVTLMPVAMAMGLPLPIILGAYPAVNGYFFLPTYGTILAAVSFDQTGTTKIGKYLVNHSFMLPGMVVTITATIFAMIISNLYFS